MTMNKSELDDFKTALSKHGYSETDFELNEIDLTNWTPNTIVSIHGEITIKRKSTNKKRTYPSGNGTHWVVDFETELKQGIFN